MASSDNHATGSHSSTVLFWGHFTSLGGVCGKNSVLYFNVEMVIIRYIAVNWYIYQGFRSIDSDVLRDSDLP